MNNTDACCIRLQQIRDNWDTLKKTNRLRSSISQLITMAKMDLSVDDVIDIEESIPKYLNKLDKAVKDESEIRK